MSCGSLVDFKVSFGIGSDPTFSSDFLFVTRIELEAKKTAAIEIISGTKDQQSRGNGIVCSQRSQLLLLAEASQSSV